MGLLSVCRDPPSNYSFPSGEGSGSMSRAERGGRGPKFPAPFAELPKEGIWAGEEKNGAPRKQEGFRDRARCQGMPGALRVWAGLGVGPGAPPTPLHPLGGCGNPSQTELPSVLYLGDKGWVSRSLLSRRSGTGSAGKGVACGSEGGAPLLS